MKKKFRFKYIYKDYYMWQDFEFLRNVNNNELVSQYKFDNRKITKIEQEDWFNTFYKVNVDYHIWIVYDEEKSCPVGYVTLDIDSIKHRRVRFDYAISPEFNYLRCDKRFIRWSTNKARTIELDVHKIWSYVLITDNNRIERLSESGFEIDGLLRDFIYKNNQYLSVYVMSILFS